MITLFKAMKDWVLGTSPKDAEFDAYQKSILHDTHIVHSRDIKFDMFRRSIALACLNYNRETYATRTAHAPTV